jgi:hypothetical protein
LPWLLINLLGYILKVSEKKKPWHAVKRAKVFLWWCGSVGDERNSSFFASKAAEVG